MYTLIVFIIVLGLLVFVHEFGHFYAARRNGVKVHEFGFGFPPRICGFRKVNGKYKFFWGNKEVESEDTIYSLNLIPLGGFVKIKGEQGEHADDPDSFANKKAWPRFVILVAGVMMNFLLGFIFLAIGYMAGMPVPLQDHDTGDSIRDIRVQIAEVQSDSAAANADIQMADTVIAINGEKITQVGQLQTIISESDTKLTFELERGDKTLVKEIEPKVNDAGEKRIGVALIRTGIKDYPWYQAIWMGFTGTFIMIKNIVVQFGILIANLFKTGEAGVELAGPVGIAILTGRFAEQGLVYLMQFIAVLSINLGVINLFPIPALDGGRILFLAIEKIRNKPVSKEFESATIAFSFLLLLGLMLVITFRDIIRIW